MLGTVDRQGSLLGMDSLLARLFEGDDSSFYARMAADGDELISDEDFADCYSAGMGRPSITMNRDRTAGTRASRGRS